MTPTTAEKKEPITMDDLIKLKDVMVKLKVSRTFMNNLKRDGRVKFIYLGGKIFLNRKEIEKILNS